MKEDLIEFEKYVNNYDMKEDMIDLKYYHTLRVIDLCADISKSLNLSDEQILVSQYCGLFHDYMRFEQWTKYKSFSDEKYEHADEAVKKLFDEGEISKYHLDKKYYDIVKDAVKNHNKYEIDKSLNSDSLLMSKIIRDADKIDIYYLIAIGRIKEDDTKERITESVKKDFLDGKLVSRNDRKNVNDLIISTLSLVYNIYFDHSISILKERQLIENIEKHIKHKEIFKEYFDVIYKYIERRTRNVRN